MSLAEETRSCVYSFVFLEHDERVVAVENDACVRVYMYTCALMHAHTHRRRKQTSEVVERERQKEHEAAAIAADRRRCARLRSCAGGRSQGYGGVERRERIRRGTRRCRHKTAASRARVGSGRVASRARQVISSDR